MFSCKQLSDHKRKAGDILGADLSLARCAAPNIALSAVGTFPSWDHYEVYKGLTDTSFSATAATRIQLLSQRPIIGRQDVKNKPQRIARD
jgi:hypothetical protein